MKTFVHSRNSSIPSVNINNENEKEIIPPEEIGVSIINANKSVSYGVYRELGAQANLPLDLMNNPKIKFLSNFKGNATSNDFFFSKRNHSLGSLKYRGIEKTKEVYGNENPKLKKKLKNLLSQK